MTVESGLNNENCNYNEHNSFLQFYKISKQKLCFCVNLISHLVLICKSTGHYSFWKSQCF